MWDLAELFVQIRWLHLRRLIIYCIVNWNIPTDELGLGEFDYFNSDQQRYGHHVGEQEHPSEECCTEYLDVPIPFPRTLLVLRPWHVNHSVIYLNLIPNCGPSRSNWTHDALDEKYNENGSGDHLFKIGLLLLWSHWISHNPGIVTSVSYDSNDPFCVSQTRTSEKQIVGW